MLYSQHFTFHWKLLVYNVDTSLGGAGANLQTVFLVFLGSVKVGGRGKGKQEHVLLPLASRSLFAGLRGGDVEGFERTPFARLIQILGVLKSKKF